MIFFPANLWAASCLQGLSSKEDAAEFCANILDDNKYELLLTKNIEIPQNKKWRIPDSLYGGCLAWEYNYLLDAPQSTKEDDFELSMRRGGHSCISANSDKKKRKVEPLKMELVKGNSYLGYFLENAKESLKKYYGKRIKGDWFAQLYNSKIKLSANFAAVITGECFVNSNIAEFCADFDKDSNEYSLHLVKNLNLDPDSNWVFPDSVVCAANTEGPIWDTEYSLDAPYDPDTSFIGRCVALGVSLSKDTICIKPRIAKVNLDPTNRDVLHNHKYRAKETLKSYYGKRFNGHWKAQFRGTGFTYEKSFEAVIVGPCSKKGIVAEYCINEYHNLVLEKELDYIPRYIFASASECDFCNKNYKETITTGVDYGDGKFTLVEELLQKSCEDYVLYEYFRLPQNIKKEKSLYGKVLPVRINAEIQSDESHRKDYYDFKIRVKGPCEK